jgi:galactokinase
MTSLADRFAAELGTVPDGVWSAPGRVNLLGEHTDYNDGFVLPAAIDLGCQAAVRRRDDGVLHVRSVQAGDSPAVRLADVAPGDVAGWSAYAVGVAWALREQGLDLPGADVLVDSTVPSGAGLSSSAALECSVGLALCELAGVDIDLTTLALAGQRAERDVVGAPVGVMDQMASVHGAAGSAVFLDCRSLAVERVPLPLADRDLTLLVVDTRVAHAHATGGYASRRRACEEAAEILSVTALRDATAEQVQAAASELGDERFRRARHIVTENARVLAAVQALRTNDLDALGPLLAAGHASLRDDFEVSCPELDLAVDAALEAGALAARMTGGGFGGSVVAVVPRLQVDDVAEACRQAAVAADAPEPRVRVVVASAGAHRVQ